MKKKFLKDLKEYIPGKSVEEVAEELGLDPEKIIKLASNENPLGPSPKAREAVEKNLGDLAIFPDPLSIRELKNTISDNLKVPEKNIVLSSGSDGVFDILSKILIDKEQETIIPLPTFSMYEFVTRVAGGNPVFVKRGKDFSIPVEEIISKENQNTKLVFVCSPNNPTGNLAGKEDIERILKEVNSYVLVDEAYIEYADSGSSCIDLFGKYNNLIITRTFSKVYGLANLRLGFGILPDELVPDFNKANLPFFTSSLAVKAGKAAMEDQEYTDKVVKTNKEERKYVEGNIGFKVFPSQSNFVLTDVSPFKAEEVVSKMKKKGIILRDCSSFGEGMERFVRISIGTREQNQKFIEGMNSIGQKGD
mgnify:FL=1